MPISGVTFDNIRIEMTDDPKNVGGQAAMAKWLKDTKEAGFMCYNTEDIELRNVRIERAIGASLSVNRSKNITIDNFRARRAKTADAPAIELNDVSGASVSNCVEGEGKGIFLSVNGSLTADVRLWSNHIGKPAEAVKVGKDVPKGAVNAG
jgi:hypothetical protein